MNTRIFTIGWELSRLCIFYITTPKGKRESQEMGKRLRQTFERLGPTFIKLGQMLSMRPDFLPEVYCIELEYLLDSAPALSGKEMRKILVQEFKKPVEQIFKDFRELPLAAASLSQVHKATLFSGEEVVVKFLRPGVKKIIKDDIACMIFVTRLFGNIFFKEKEHFIDLLSTLKNWLAQETDYEHELKNIQIVGRELTDNEHVHVPIVYKDLSTKNVITMEYIDGYSVLDIIRLKRKGELPSFPFSIEELLEHVVEEMGLNSLYRGHFHADLHPANLIIRPDGTICLLDFGLIQYFDKNTRKDVTLFMAGMALCSPELILQACKRLATFNNTYNEKKVFAHLNELCDSYKNAPASQLSNSQFLAKVFHIGFTNGITFDWTLTLYTRSAMHLDGMILKLCPDFVFSAFSRDKFLKIYGEIVVKEIISIPTVLRKTDDIVEMIRRYAEVRV
jgi:ubiquinone biosynthesis protein